jgi:sigma-B regulation protein RsbU (phosphoserine phosphatase)
VADPDHLDFRDMLENSPAGYVALQPNGHIEYVNGTFLAWTGHCRDAMIGKRLSEFLTMAGRIYYETHIAPLLRMQNSFEEFAIDVVGADGQPIQTIANARESRDKSGKATSIRLAFIRATDRRRYEQELLAAREMAKAAEKAIEGRLRTENEASVLREQFIAVLGHDLRNPLASISAGARILDRSARSEKEHQIIAMMQATIIRMAELIDNVLDLARGRLGGGLTVDRDPAKPLEPVLAQVIDELRLASPGRVIETEIELTKPVDCDPTRVGQLLSNLLGNALTHGSADKPVMVRAITTDTAFELSVSNQGIPIPAALMDKLFEPFFRGAARPSKQGLGLGLYIASEIAKAHGGEMTVSSDPSSTTFKFKMPLHA